MLVALSLGASPIARRRMADRSLVSASLHYTLALIGAGRCDAARELATGFGKGGAVGDQATIASEIGAPVAAALTAFGKARYGEAAQGLLSVRPKLRRIGGKTRNATFSSRCLLRPPCARA